ncbi:MAG: ABC transporter ATP-binding protein [Deltaproteobacteria bacterium]|jgi:iron complex transport system ATP-binding protein|nr:ABC transporter ATP-binding protein [Deltaproteobacteria bacterium]
MIDVKGLSFAYRRHTPTLMDVSFQLGPGDILSILGPNGCGKTTLLKSILGFLPINPKTVFINSHPVESYPRSFLAKILAYVPQFHGGVFPFKVLDMVMMGRTARRKWGGFDRQDIQKAHQALERVGISSLANQTFTELSGGQKQLVIIARALAQSSQFILMDEPTSGLDLSNQTMVLRTMKRLHETEGLTFLMTTHHPEQALYLGGQVLMMRAGRVVSLGAARLLTTAAAVEDLYGLEAGLLESMGLVPACLGNA